MGLPDRFVDGLQLFLTGGSSNANPDASLGGAASTTRVRGLGAVVSSPLPAIRVDNVFPACGEGDATLAVDASGKLVFTPPGGAPGVAVALAAGTSAIVAGSDANKALRVHREAGWLLPVGNQMSLKLVDIMNGILGQKNITNAQRVAGVITYRALMLKAPSLGVSNIRIWFPPVTGLQSTYSVAVETPVAGYIQTLANETTAPSGLTWYSPADESSAFSVGDISAGGSLGLWIRKVFPSGGIVRPREDVRLAMKYRGQ